MTDTNLPIRWDDELAKSAKEVASLERPALSQISLRAGVMTYQKSPVPGNKLNVVVLASVFENKYFAGKLFDPNNYQSPVCFALSTTGDDMTPHEESEDIQSGSCSSCDWSKWGSQGGGKKGKACKEARRLALIPESAITDGNIGSAELAVISIPVTSIKNWANYVNAIAGEYSRPPWAIVTEIRAEPDPRTQFQVKFRVVRTVDDEYLGALHKRILSATDVLLTPYDSSGTIAGAPAPIAGENQGKARKF